MPRRKGTRTLGWVPYRKFKKRGRAIQGRKSDWAYKDRYPTRGGGALHGRRKLFLCTGCGTPTNQSYHVGGILVIACSTCLFDYPLWEEFLPPEWMNRAACIGKPPPSIWHHSEREDKRGARPKVDIEQLSWAMEYCTRCPVWRECARYAKEVVYAGATYGNSEDEVYAGLTRRGIMNADDVVWEAEKVLAALSELPPDAGGDV